MRGTGAISELVPIGRPISNTRAYILDDQLQPVRPGVIGELYAGGDGIARGYLNNPDATNEKFPTDHFSEAPGARMYRTGDLACWRADGIIEFHGRADDQIKILGHRVEPAEVEVALGACESIKQVCVVPYTDGNGTRRLVAYYVGSLAGVTANELRAFLAQKVPQYMILAAFVPLDALPLSPNGKVDRAVLPRPWCPPTQTGVNAEPEANQLEKAIADLWSQVLGAKQVGLDSNFFDLGGDFRRHLSLSIRTCKRS